MCASWFSANKQIKFFFSLLVFRNERARVKENTKNAWIKRKKEGKNAKNIDWIRMKSCVAKIGRRYRIEFPRGQYAHQTYSSETNERGAKEKKTRCSFLLPFFWIFPIQFNFGIQTMLLFHLNTSMRYGSVERIKKGNIFHLYISHANANFFIK